MSTELRNVPNLDCTQELTQTRFWGGQDRKACLQVTQNKARGFEKPTTADGKAAHQAMKQQGYFDTLRCRDVLGGLRFEYNLINGQKLA